MRTAIPNSVLVARALHDLKSAQLAHVAGEDDAVTTALGKLEDVLLALKEASQ